MLNTSWYFRANLWWSKACIWKIYFFLLLCFSTFYPVKLLSFVCHILSIQSLETKHETAHIRHTYQGRRKVWKSEGVGWVSNNVVGIICHLGWNKVTYLICQNRGVRGDDRPLYSPGSYTPEYVFWFHNFFLNKNRDIFVVLNAHKKYYASH